MKKRDPAPHARGNAASGSRRCHCAQSGRRARQNMVVVMGTARMKRRAAHTVAACVVDDGCAGNRDGKATCLWLHRSWRMQRRDHDHQRERQWRVCPLSAGRASRCADVRRMPVCSAQRRHLIRERNAIDPQGYNGRERVWPAWGSHVHQRRTQKQERGGETVVEDGACATQK